MRSSIEISPTVTLKALSYVSSFHAAREKSLKRIQKAVRWKDVFPLERVEMSFDSFFFFFPPFFHLGTSSGRRKKKTGFIGVTRGRLRFHRSERGPMNEWLDKRVRGTRVTNVCALPRTINLSPLAFEKELCSRTRGCFITAFFVVTDDVSECLSTSEIIERIATPGITDRTKTVARRPSISASPRRWEDWLRRG